MTIMMTKKALLKHNLYIIEMKQQIYFNYSVHNFRNWYSEFWAQIGSCVSFKGFVSYIRIRTALFPRFLLE